MQWTKSSLGGKEYPTAIRVILLWSRHGHYQPIEVLHRWYRSVRVIWQNRSRLHGHQSANLRNWAAQAVCKFYVPLACWRIKAEWLLLIILATGWPIPNTAMDLAAVLDHTLLHELTHTFYGGGLDDKGRLMGPYGWTNCVSKNPVLAVSNAGKSTLKTSNAYICSN